MTDHEMKSAATTWIEESLIADKHKRQAIKARDEILKEIGTREGDKLFLGSFYGTLFTAKTNGIEYSVHYSCSSLEFFRIIIQ